MFAQHRKKEREHDLSLHALESCLEDGCTVEGTFDVMSTIPEGDTSGFICANFRQTNGIMLILTNRMR